MQNINKNLRFSPCRNWQRIDCLYSGWRFTARGEIFTVWGEKSLAVRELVQDTYLARSEAANPIHFKLGRIAKEEKLFRNLDSLVLVRCLRKRKLFCKFERSFFFKFRRFMRHCWHIVELSVDQRRGSVAQCFR
jgi:hypothetical protein